MRIFDIETRRSKDPKVLMTIFMYEQISAFSNGRKNVNEIEMNEHRRHRSSCSCTLEKIATLCDEDSRLHAIISMQENSHSELVLQNNVLASHISVRLRSDLGDSGMAFCSAEVIQVFKENFDLETLLDFSETTLADDLLGNKVALEIISSKFLLKTIIELRASMY